MSEATNGLDEVKLNRYVGEIEKIDDELLSEKMSYVSRCRPYQERKKDWKQRAASDGIPKAALNTMLRERSLLLSIAKLNAKVEDIDERAFIVEMREKLKPVADLPLFGAAIDAAERDVKRRSGRTKKAGDASETETPTKNGALDDLADGADSAPKRDINAEAGAQNAALLKSGIKPLHN